MHIHKELLDALNDEDVVETLCMALIADIGRNTRYSNMIKSKMNKIEANTKETDGLLGALTFLDNMAYNLREILKKHPTLCAGGIDEKYPLGQTGSMLLAHMLTEHAKDNYDIDILYNKKHMGISPEEAHNGIHDDLFISMRKHFIS